MDTICDCVFNPINVIRVTLLVVDEGLEKAP